MNDAALESSCHGIGIAPLMFLNDLRDEIRSIIDRDPAARTALEVAICYPGLKAVVMYRAAHWLWRRDWTLLARCLSQFSRFLTGIEIHPAATIGRRLFIDHGMGVVIGATAIVGDDCTLYHGVTLGGTALHDGRRHPTLGNNVIVGSGAQILGAIDVGDGARIGANAVVVHAVAPHTTVVGIPGKPVSSGAAKPRPLPAEQDAFLPYGTPCEELLDPLSRTVTALLDEVSALRMRVNELESHAEGAPAVNGHATPLSLGKGSELGHFSDGRNGC